jgi:hypothetical protein
MMPELVDFDQLRESFPRLYRTISKATGHRTNTYAVDISKLNDFTRGELSAWLKTQREKSATPAPVVTPVAQSAPVVVKREEPESIRDSMDISKNDERRRVEQQARDEEAFEARLEEWGRGGLETTQENANAIVDWIKQHPQLKGYVSAQAADLAVAWLGPKGSNVLTWKPQVEALPPPAPEPTEVLATLTDGTAQLPLDQPIPKNASKE